MREASHAWAIWRTMIRLLRTKGLPYMREHADRLERDLETHGPGEAVVTIAMSDDVYLRSYTYARVELGLPYQGDGR